MARVRRTRVRPC